MQSLIIESISNRTWFILLSSDNAQIKTKHSERILFLFERHQFSKDRGSLEIKSLFR